jgi:hypothetical protein
MAHGASFLKKLDDFATDIFYRPVSWNLEKKMWSRVHSGVPATSKSELAEKAVGVALPPAIR